MLKPNLIHFSIAMPFYRKRYKWFMASAKKNAIETQLITGWRKLIKFEKKISYQHEFVSKLADNDIVLFTDAYDVLIVRDKRKILEAFYRLNAPVVFAAEKTCWPDPGKKTLFPASASPWRFLNSGGWIGVVKNVKEVLSIAVDIYKSGKNDGGTDQRIYTDIYLDNPGKIKLDTNCEIFQTLLRSENDMIFENNTWTNKITGTRPCIIHANGLKRNILPIARKLGYDWRLSPLEDISIRRALRSYIDRLFKR